MKRTAIFAAAMSAACAFPAHAQETVPPLVVASGVEESVFDGDWLAIGAGGGYSTSYDGSDDYVVYPLPALAGSLGGIGISPRAGGVALDLLDGMDQGRVSF